MAVVVVERAFEEPVTFEDIECTHHRWKWCLEINSGTPLLHGLDGSRRRSLCIYEAPDIEAIRRVGQQMAITPAPRMWAASAHGPWQATGALPELQRGENGFALLDRVFSQPVTFDDFGEEEVAHNACLSIYGVRFLSTLFSHDRTRMVCLYATPDLEAVRAVNRTARYPFTEIWSAQPHPAGIPGPAPGP